MTKLSFKPWYGQVYQRFNIMVQLPDRKKRIGRILAPNNELALIKSRELFADRDVFVEMRADKQKRNARKRQRKNS